MFRCDTCHTEYGGIRGLPSGTCPRCRKRDAGIARPVMAATTLSSYAGAPWPSASGRSVAPIPMVGEIARLDRAVRL